jgi:hypothetical protein
MTDLADSPSNSLLSGGCRRWLAGKARLEKPAVELLLTVLSGEIRIRRQKNVVQARSFAELLEQAIRRY